MSASRVPISAAFRRKLLAKPGITKLPVCDACQREVQPRDFGHEFCRACEAERAEAAVYFQAQLDATLSDVPVPPAEPMFGSAEAAQPFLPEDEDAARFAAFLRRLAEHQAYALAGDTQSRLVLGEYALARWCDVAPERALAEAEGMVRTAYPNEHQPSASERRADRRSPQHPEPPLPVRALNGNGAHIQPKNGGAR